MNRILLVCNAVLALFLAIRLADSTSPALASDAHARRWRAEDLRLVPVAPRSGDSASAASRQEFLLHLGAEVGAEPLPPEPVDLGLCCEPSVELATAWHATSILRVVVQQALLPARRYRLHFTRDLRAQDGRVLPAGSSVTLVTPSVAVSSVVVDDDPAALPGRGGASLRVELDTPVPLANARQFLGLADAGSGERLPTHVEVAPGSDERVFRVWRAEGELPPVVHVVLGKGLVPRGGEVPLARDVKHEVDVYQPLALVAAEATPTAIVLRFNRAVGAFDAALVGVSPAGEARCRVEPEGLCIEGSFAAGSLVRVDLAAGFPGRGRSSLGVAVRRTVLIPDRPPSLEVVGDGEVLSARAEPVLTLRGCNVERVRLRLRRVYDNNVVRLLQRADQQVYEPSPIHELPIQAARNVEWRERVDLRQLLGKHPGGIYQVELLHDRQYWPEQRLLQVTDLGVTVRAGRDGAFVQVVSLADGAPIADAQVEVLTPTNQLLASGHCDARGLVHLQWPHGMEDHRPFVVQVHHGEDRAFVGMDRFAVELGDEGLGGRAYVRDGIEALVWPSRGIVRPGERFQVAVLARTGSGESAVDRDLRVVFQAPGGKEFQRSRLATPGSGLAAAVLELPLDAPCGAWSVTVFADEPPVGRAAFEVAAFVPNRLEAELQVAADVRLGAPLLVRVHGTWLDGTPATSRPTLVRARLLRGSFAPAGLPGYSFASGGDEPPPGELAAVEGVLDAAGNADLRLMLPARAAPQVLTAVVMAEVLDPSGRPVRVQREVSVYRPDFQLGVRAEPRRVHVCAVRPDGEVVAAEAAQLRIERRRWTWRYEARDGRRWSWRADIEAVVVHEAQVPLAAGRGFVDLPELAGEGWFVAVATCGEVRAEQALGAVPRAPDRLRVRAKAPAAPGEMAELEIDAPAAGRGFVTLESDVVHSATVVQLVAGHNRVAVAVPASLRLPNLHAVVTLTRAVPEAKAGAGPAWIVGGACVPLRRDDVQLVTGLMVPATVLPETELPVQVEAPGASLALVAVVDEGVLDVTGHRAPDPVAFFLGARALAVAGADTGVRLIRDMEFAPRSKTGGDDDDLASQLRGGSVSPHIRPLALFAELPLDAEGRGRTAFRLPAYEGRVRVLVLAAGAQRFGSAVGEVVVKAPLGLLVAVPRTVAPADRFVVPITVRNDLGADAVVTVEVDASAALKLPAGRRHEVAVPAGRAATVEVAMLAEAGGEGTQRIVVAASSGSSRRSVTEHVVVRTARLPAREFVGIRLGEAQTVQVAGDWEAAGLRASVALDVRPDRHLRPALDALLEYPYGCCEQTASLGMALATCAVLLPRLPASASTPAVLPRVQAAVDRIFAMQGARGGFGWWFADRSDHAFVTVHAVDFLLHAGEVGAELPAAAMARAVDRLQQFAATAEDLDLRCHAVEVLVRCGRPVQPRLDWLCAQPVGAEARARLATALALLGDRRRAADLLRHDEVGPDTFSAAAAERLASPVRSQALHLRARLAIDPADAELPVLVAALQRCLLRPDRLTTQEQAQGLRAVADYYRRQQASAGAPQLSLAVDGASVPVPPGGDVELSVRPGAVLRFGAGGSGFVLLGLRGMRPPAPRAESGLELRREFVDLDTGAPVTQLRRGRVYEVRVHGVASETLRDLVLVDLLPGGCESEPATAVDRGDADAAEHGDARALPPTLRPANIEARDDRVLLFFREIPRGQFLVRHRIRAVFPGDYSVAPLQAQAMYSPGLAAAGQGDARLVVLP